MTTLYGTENCRLTCLYDNENEIYTFLHVFSDKVSHSKTWQRRIVVARFYFQVLQGSVVTQL